MTKLSRRSVWMLPLVVVGGCVSARPSVSQLEVPEEIVRSEARFRREYVWAAGDQLEVVVRGAPEASRTLVIRPDGFISLPLVDDVRAAGLTPSELKRDLVARFSERLVDPEVTVIAVQVPPPVVYVMGQVGNNMAVPLRNAPTAAQAIAFAGGLRPSANPDATSIIRLGEDGYLHALSAPRSVGGQPGATFALRTVLLQPDDIIFVPESGRGQVARFLNEIVNQPLATLTGIVGLVVNFRLIEVLSNR